MSVWNPGYAPTRRRPQESSPVSAVGLGRVIDVSVAVLGLVLLAPILLVIAAIVWIAEPGPLLFRHRRVGYGGAPFDCLKFRSMSLDADARLAELLASDPLAAAEWAADHKLRRDPRVTPVGAFLRKTSLDELPQLVNVILGQMSLVGPRPIVEAEVAKYGQHFKRYCAVKPGITGLWQVSGRNDVSYRTRVALDCLYARRKSLRLDMAILAATIPAVLARKGSY